MGTATFGARGIDTQGTLEEVTSAKRTGKRLFIIKMCDMYEEFEVRGASHGSRKPDGTHGRCELHGGIGNCTGCEVASGGVDLQ